MGKSKVAKRGIESTHWHNDPATFGQTSRLRKMTGLKTWDLPVAITKKQASDLIGKNDAAYAKKWLMEFGCIPYVRDSKSTPVKAKVVESPKATAKPKVESKPKVTRPSKVKNIGVRGLDVAEVKAIRDQIAAFKASKAS